MTAGGSQRTPGSVGIGAEEVGMSRVGNEVGELRGSLSGSLAVAMEVRRSSSRRSMGFFKVKVVLACVPVFGCERRCSGELVRDGGEGVREKGDAFDIRQGTEEAAWRVKGRDGTKDNDGGDEAPGTTVDA
jgi:hypothetical protein